MPHSSQHGSMKRAIKTFNLFLLLVRYIPNVAKRSIWDQCKKKYILRTDRRPTSNRPRMDRRPTTDWPTSQFWKYLRKALSDPLHVWFYSGVFEVRGSNGAISGFAKCKMAARPPSWKIQITISPWRIIRFTLCLVLGWGFRGRRIVWR